MRPESADRRSGLLTALAGFALLSAGDGLIKSIDGAWPGTAVAALRYFFGAAGLGALLWLSEGRAGFRLTRGWAHLGRGVAVAVATITFFMAIFLMPLAEATAIQFTNPMLTALLSAMLLGERASRTAIAATLVAFAGVLVVLRPNVAALGWAAVLPLIAAFGMAVLMILNRRVAGSGSVLAMQFWVAAFACPVLIVATALGHVSGIGWLAVDRPDAAIVLRCALVAVSASVAHLLIYLATTRASAAVIAPAVYIQLIVAIAIGVAFYGDIPDLISLGGSAIIVAAGLWLWRNEGRPAIVKHGGNAMEGRT